MKALPLLLFGAMCVTAGLLGLTLPETLNTKLPDTIKEAENIREQNKEYSKDFTEVCIKECCDSIIEDT